MKILVEKAVIEQALGVLEKHVESFDYEHFTSVCELDPAKDTILTLREALGKPELWHCNKCGKNHCQCPPWIESNYKPVEQAEQEPVAWWCCVPGQDPVLLFDEPSDARYPPNYKEPLYTHPVRTKDLTDDEILEADNRSHGNTEWTKKKAFARAVIEKFKEKNRG